MDLKILYNAKTLILFVVLLIISTIALGGVTWFGHHTVSNNCTNNIMFYGFPFSFMTSCELWSPAGQADWSFTRAWYLIADLIVWYIVSIVLVFLYTKLRK